MDEKGAGGLLPIITIGMVVIIVAAFIASSTTFAAKISGDQVASMTTDLEVKSLLNDFTSNALSDAPFLPEAEISGAGSYTTYYSTADEAPKEVSDPELTPVDEYSGIPADARWILLELSTESGSPRTAVFSYVGEDKPVFDNLLAWNGSASITDSTLQAAPGSRGPVTLVLGESATAPESLLTIANSNVSADIYAGYGNGTAEVKGGTMRGTLSSEARILLNDMPKVLGNVYSSSMISGEGEVAGLTRSNDGTRPVPAAQTANRLAILGQTVQLTPADCSTASELKSKLESIDRDTTLLGADVCDPSSWKTNVSLKSNVLVSSDSVLTVDGLTVKGSTSSLGFSTKDSLTLKNVSYENGAHGQFLSAGSMVVKDSNLSGAISDYSTAGSNVGNLTMEDSTVLYTPSISSLLGDCGGSPCAISSNIVHLVQVK